MATARLLEMASKKSLNTFHLESPKPFRPCELKRAAEEFLVQALTGDEEAIPSNALPGLAQRLATELREKVLDYEFLRYKFIVTIHVADKLNQGICIKSRPLWDSDRDNYITCKCETQQVLVVATIYAIYYD